MPHDLQRRIQDTAFSFRGYNVRNLGKTPELLAHPIYGPTIEHHLRGASEICGEEIGQQVDLVRRVRERDEPGLDHYAEAVALVMAVEFAHIELLQNFFGIHFSEAKLAFGYSLGELAAVSAAGVMAPEHAMRVPIAMAEDSAALSHNVTMGVLFSRGPVIDENDVRRLCRQITAEANGTIGVSAILSPNTYLLLGQNETVDRFAATMHEALPAPVHLRVNPDRWPPLHTEIARQKHIPDRASVMMERLPGGFVAPCPPVVSLVTGKRSYDDLHARDIMRAVGRSAAAAMGRRVRNARFGRGGRGPRRTRPQRDTGHLPAAERQRPAANLRPLVWQLRLTCRRPARTPSLAIRDSAQPRRAAAGAVGRANHSRRLAVGACDEFASVSLPASMCLQQMLRPIDARELCEKFK